MLIHINPLYNLNNQGALFFIANHVHVPCPIHPKMLLIGRWLRSFGSFAFTLTWTEAAGDPLLLLLRTGNYQPNWRFGFERMSSIDERLMLQWVAPWKLLNTCNTVCACMCYDIRYRFRTSAEYFRFTPRFHWPLLELTLLHLCPSLSRHLQPWLVRQKQHFFLVQSEQFGVWSHIFAKPY